MTRRFTIRDLQASFMSQAPHGGPIRETALMQQTAPKERTGKNKQPEAQLQMACVRYLDSKHPEILFWAVPMSTWIGGNKVSGKVLGYLAKQKLLGNKKGIPDICLLLPGGKFCFAELKAAKGVPSEEQGYYLKKCEELGGFSAVIKNIDQLEELIQRAKNG